MRRLRPLLFPSCLLILCAALPACQQKRKPLPNADQQAQQPQGPAELAKIVALEDQRSLGEGQLVQWAREHAEPVVRARALLALARIRAPSTADAIAEALQDSAPLPRYEAAFAAGTLGVWQPLPDAARAHLVQKLLAVEASEAEMPVRLTQLEALGRIGSPAAVERLVERLFGSPPEVQARAALSLGVAAKNGATLPTRAVTGVLPLLKADATAGQRFGAAYALAMSKLAGARAGLLLCTRDAEGEVRLLCARGLGEVGTESDAVTLKRLLDDPDYRVVVEATRALARLADKCRGSTCPAIGALADLGFRVERLEGGDVAGGAQPILALAQQGLPASGRPLLTTLRQRVITAAAAAQGTLKQDLANLDCRLAAALDRQSGKMAEVLDCGGGLVSETRRLQLGLREVASTPTKDAVQRIDAVAPYIRHNDAAVKVAAVDALGETRSMKAADRIRPLIPSDDLILATSAASAAGKMGDTESVAAIRALAQRLSKHPDLVPPVAEALAALKAKDAEPDLRAWLQHPHRNVRLAAAQALTKLTGAPVEVPHVDGTVEGAPKPATLPKNAKLVIRTEKGDIEVRLFEDAPVTAGNLYQLARKGFYRNLTFHRVVPDFVVQGGDPRGDGAGGPGYTIRDELNHHPYAAGVVGMALSGPDTGGSQFFITHSPQPHLDGRYTAFGEVVSGRDVVHQLLEGDKILEIRAQ